MTNGIVSFNPEEAGEAIARWRAYGDQVELHGAADPAMLARLRHELGDTYADFIDAKAVEQHERAGAYQRVAAQARSHAQKLANTRTNFDHADSVNKAGFDAIDVD